MVLANGDIHRVNRFLIGPRGELQPQHRPAAPADFLEAWIPHAACKQRNSLPPVFAISQGKVPWHFDGTHWSAMPLPHTGAVASNK